MRSGAFAAGVALFLVTVFLQDAINPMRDKIQPSFGGKEQTKLIFQLPGPYIIASFTGMRETVAGLLWVRADEFFHEGDYESILPLVRIITWLDPHYMDVYKTGAWHLDFNICDSEERSDRRYIPPALALLREGIRNNDTTYDLPFDMGFTHYYLKIKDYGKAAYWVDRASKLPDLNPATRESPGASGLLVQRMLAHMYEKTGDIEASRKTWKTVLDRSLALAAQNPKNGVLWMGKHIAINNYNLILWRIERRKTDIYPPVDMKFEVNWVRKKPRMIVVSGKMNLISRADYLKFDPKFGVDKDSLRTRLEAILKSPYVDGARVDIQLHDIDYKPQVLEDFSWDVPKDVTIMIDSARIADGKFQAEIDMSRDPNIYAFKRKKYVLTVSFDPRGAPDFIQDRIGWHGEGLTDKKYLDTKTIPGVRMIRKQWIIDLKDLT